jgi:hypothetical protein
LLDWEDTKSEEYEAVGKAWSYSVVWDEQCAWFIWY